MTLSLRQRIADLGQRACAGARNAVGGGPTGRVAPVAVIAVIAVLIVPILLTGVFVASIPYRGIDVSAWTMMVEVVRHGGRPYVDLWDNKPPAIFGLHYFYYLLEPRGTWAYRLGDTFLIAGAALGVAFMVYRLRRCVLWALTGALFCVTFMTHPLIYYGGGTVEIPTAFLGTMAVLVVFSWGTHPLGYAAAGLLGGLAFWFRPNEVLFLGAIGLHALVALRGGRRVAALAALCGAFALVVAAGCALLHLQGVWGAFWDEAILYNVFRKPLLSERLHGYVRMLGRWGFTGFLFPLALGLAHGLATVVRGPGEEREPWLLLPAWLAASLCTALYGGIDSGNYYQSLAPSVAANAACAMAWLFARRRESFLTFVTAMGAVLLIIWPTLMSFAKEAALQPPEPKTARVAQVVKQYSSPDETLLVVGETASEVHLRSQRRPVCPFYSVQIFFTDAPPALRWRAQFLRQIREHPPAVIVLYSRADDAAADQDTLEGTLSSALSEACFWKRQQIICTSLADDLGPIVKRNYVRVARVARDYTVYVLSPTRPGEIGRLHTPGGASPDAASSTPP